MFLYHTVLSRWTIIRKRDTRPPTSPYLRAHEESEAPTTPPPEKTQKGQLVPHNLHVGKT